MNTYYLEINIQNGDKVIMFENKPIDLETAKNAALHISVTGTGKEEDGSKLDPMNTTYVMYPPTMIQSVRILPKKLITA